MQVERLNTCGSTEALPRVGFDNGEGSRSKGSSRRLYWPLFIELCDRWTREWDSM